MSQTLLSTTINNSQGVSATLLNYGARLVSLKIPIAGKPTEMLLGYRDLGDYLSDPFYMGAVCGRVCNRISNACFEFNGNRYQLDNNHGNHCLHGGSNGLSKQFWQIQQQTDKQVCLALDSPHLDQGFPGNLSLSVIYTLDSNRLSIEMQAKTDRVTPVNLTHHAYFNLGQQSCEDLLLKLNSTGFLARDSQGIPTGQIYPFSELGVDANESVRVRDFWQQGGYQQIIDQQGVDHCFVLKESNRQIPQAQLWARQTGVEMRFYSNQPTMQIYTGTFLDKPFVPNQGICLEAQGFTDAPNQREFPSIMLEPGHCYKHKTVFEFSVK